MKLVHAQFKFNGEIVYEKAMKTQALPRLGELVTVPKDRKRYRVSLIHRKYTTTGITPIKLVVIELVRP